MDESSVSGSSLAVVKVACSENGAYVDGEKHVVYAPPMAPGGVGCGGKTSVRAHKGRQPGASPWSCLAFLEFAYFVDLGTVDVVKHGAASRTLVPPPPDGIPE